MKFTLAVPFLVLSAALAVASTEAMLQEQKQILSDGHLTSAITPLTATSTMFRRRFEENASEDQNEAQDGEDENNESADENEDKEEEGDSDEAEESEDAEEEEENESQEESEDEEGEEGESEDASEDENDGVDDGDDGYTFYDDVAIQNCEEGDEDCEKAAAYAAYDEEDLANCEEDDEECNDAAAYMNAKKNQEQQQDETNPWDVKNYTDKYNSMSKTSKIWFIALAVWFALLGIFTCYLCCCRKGYVSKKAALQESLIEDKKEEPSPNGKESV